MTDEARADRLLQVLPKEYGERFLKATVFLTGVAGVAFLFFAPADFRETVLQKHSIFEGNLSFINLILLALQWIAFYIAMNLVSFASIAVAAVWAYGKRVAKLK